jgi:hypothetical protein
MEHILNNSNLKHMKKAIIAGILLIAASLSAYCQDTSKVKTKKLPPDIKNFGQYTVITDNGKITVKKNPNYDSSKVLKRDTSFRSRWDNGIVEIYTSNTDQPVIKKHFIYDLNDVASERTMSKDERMAKYNSRKGVLVVHLKPGAITVNETDLLSKFNIPEKNYNLPLYVNYEPIAKPDSLLAVPSAVLKIETVTDGDGFKFLNITTKEWDIQRKKDAGKDIGYIR